MQDLFDLDLRLFDGEGGGAPAGNAAGGAPTAPSGRNREGATPMSQGAASPGRGWGDHGELRKGDAQKATTVLYGADAQQPDQGAQDQAGQADAKPTFDDLIKGEYKDEYEKRLKAQLDRRFKAQESILQRQKALDPVLGLLAQRYGVAPDNVEALARAIEDDEELYAQEAADKGVSVQQLKRVKQLERENQGLQRAMAEQQRRQVAEQKFAEWTRQAEEARRIYPGLDFETEIQNEDFLKLLRAGVDVRAAYEVVHRDDIIGGAMQYTAQQVAGKVASDIQARGARPPENGAGAASASVVRKPHAADLTREDVLELARRAKRGITTTFG